MSKTPFQLNKETIIGLSLMAGVALLFFINGFVVISSVIKVYGSQKVPTKETNIDSTVFSQALKLIAQ